MKIKYFTLTVCCLIAFSCQRNKPSEEELAYERLEKVMTVIPDGNLVDKERDTNEFEADLSELNINTKKTKILEGEWTCTKGRISFLNTRFDPSDRVVFKDSTSSTFTGWGTIKFHRMAKFYNTQYSSHVYEFYVLEEDRLIFSFYNYRNEDLSMREEPVIESVELNIDFLDSERIIINFKDQKAELMRK